MVVGLVGIQWWLDLDLDVKMAGQFEETLMLSSLKWVVPMAQMTRLPCERRILAEGGGVL